jgi:hypothetical protein
MGNEVAEPEVKLPSIDEITDKDQLQDIANSTPEEIVEKLTNPKEEAVDEQLSEINAPEADKQIKKTTPIAKAQPTEAIKVVLDDGRVIKYNTKEDLIKNFKSLRMSLDKFNAERGTTLSELQRMKGIEQQYKAISEELDALKQGRTQPSKGQAMAVTPAMVQKAEEAGIDPKKFFDDLTVDNFAEKFNQLNQVAAQRAEQALEPKLQELREENRKLREEFGQIRTDMTYREQKSVFDSHYLNLMSEIGQLQGTVETLKTQWNPDQINKTITQYGADQARLILPPGDFEKWEIIESMLKETYCPVDGRGNMDITQRKLKTIKSAWAAYKADHPELDDQNVVAANRQGQEQVLATIQRVANKPPILPNNLATPDKDAGTMTIEEAQKWINTPAETLKIWERTKDPRRKKFDEAQDFIAKLT